MQRRRFLGAAGSAAVLGAGKAASASTALPFDHAGLKVRARALAAAPWQPPTTVLPPDVARFGEDDVRAIRFRGERALWAGSDLGFEVRLFHRTPAFPRKVRIFEIVAGQTRELGYVPDMFDYGRSGLDGTRLPADFGFAGFRIGLRGEPRQDRVAFLGASFFRAIGASRQYGLSARALAVDTAVSRDEEFPDFTEFYLERPAPGARTLVVHALLDAPSVAGAYRFAITPGDTTVMDIDAALYPRREMDRLGIAPCTSMFLSGENDRRVARDWRPELHDSDGLSMQTGSGEWIWRPLQNPATLRFNAFADQNPRGFGLLQRDRQFESYQDDAAAYERRPSLWVEPKGGWGRGQVQLVEIPTVDETADNVVVFWSPSDRPRGGQELVFGYRLHWGTDASAAPPLGRCRATRSGIGGTPGQPRAAFSWRFAVDFVGGDLGSLSPAAAVEALVTASRGRIERMSARPLPAIRGWRALFDVVPPADGNLEPIGLRLFLRAEGRALTETWISEWAPPSLAQRQALL